MYFANHWLDPRTGGEPPPEWLVVPGFRHAATAPSRSKPANRCSPADPHRGYAL